MEKIYGMKVASGTFKRNSDNKMFTVSYENNEYDSVFYLTASTGERLEGLFQWGYHKNTSNNCIRRFFLWDGSKTDPNTRISLIVPTCRFNNLVSDNKVYAIVVKLSELDRSTGYLNTISYAHSTYSFNAEPGIETPYKDISFNYFRQDSETGQLLLRNPVTGKDALVPDYWTESSGKIWDKYLFTYDVPCLKCKNRNDGRFVIMFFGFTNRTLLLYMVFYWNANTDFIYNALRGNTTAFKPIYLDNGDIWRPDPNFLSNDVETPYHRVPSRGLIVVDQSLVLQKSEVCDWPLEVIHQLLITPKKKGGIGLHPQQLKSNMKIYGNMLDMIMMDLKEHDESFAIQEMSKSLNHEYFVAKLIVQWVKQHLCQDNE
ncbi:hypothetical protein C9374_000807 [Naegleria lovaniensis]|uniref:Uncharacterized protein n=1 Tax=Naegleria lovaniensis TaxID=51637 RepID=A0AA88KSE9_NAELO|nr:uncharacterized protein C9374_000807 [Naegleria lovaniensis]KAG2387957.1 hypothetical protein C9374_000807 [Naegleria lovaniensis]